MHCFQMCVIYHRASQEGMMFYEQYKSAAFLGMFKKLLKATISFVISGCPSICLSAWNNLYPAGWIFMKFYV